MSAGFLPAFHALPTGSFTARYRGSRYVVTKSVFAAGKSLKLVAEELGGTGKISLNLYILKTGAALRPCEMPARKVVDFVLRLEPETG